MYENTKQYKTLETTDKGNFLHFPKIFVFHVLCADFQNNQNSGLLKLGHVVSCG